MIERKEAAAFIKRQFIRADENEHNYIQTLKGGCHHYGVIELRQLLDFIYESVPNSKEEEIDRGIFK